ncbi:MAG: type II toxin-antitoxin system HipA family toxin [Chlorobi bacterium]|nr:MAG: HipA domain-containing protein [Bacteroidota bacterium]MBL1161285.1 type II toxin-antitoxin system HipA family toxin [Chlorobiota bacterium]MBW7854321.1 HipA domain-containing protein [Candidatus Kapabacteria bacterium]MCC6332017.1 HipA domain-containing protein [Ignavibacteria bacterium]MBZ0193811.1 HipA domain-containing protein [Candidatus Kapabacteria bacterium]
MNCLYCYKELQNHERDFHAACSKKIFGQAAPPELPYSENDLEPLARMVIQSQTAITGVQAKLSLHITGNKKDTGQIFTIVGLWGGYILKPPTAFYPQLPEVEDLTMHLAAAANIKTVPHSLIRLQSGNLAYITKRVDRTSKKKLAMEDMCQLTERLTEDKYHGSYEQIGQAILRYSSTPGLDIVNFLELILFSFISGNADMHLKNFSLLEQPGIGMTLSPAYDLVNTLLVNPADAEEMALSLNGRKKKLKKRDFIMVMDKFNTSVKQQSNIFNKMQKALPKWLTIIDECFLVDDFKEQYKSIIRDRLSRLE